MSLEAFGDGGDVEDLSDAVGRFGWELDDDKLWYNEADGSGPLTDEQMGQWLDAKREGDEEDASLR
jgi:hypothetical protein